MKTGDRDTFVRLANKRVNAAIKSIQHVGKLSNRTKYDYTQSDVELIFKSLQHEIDTCRNRFELSLNIESWVEFSIEK